MKTILLFLLAASTCAAQSVSVASGAGYGAFNSAWKNAAPLWSAGLVIDNKYIPFIHRNEFVK